MRYLFFALAVFAPSMTLAQCPDLPPRSERHIELMAQVAQANSESEARVLNNQLWEIWTTAPDDIAQEILHRGMQRRSGYDFAGALKDFDTLIAYCPHYAEGYNQRAFVNFIRQNYEAALSDLDQALALTPDHIGALGGRALTLLGMGRVREGQLVLRQALELHPWLPERHRLVPLESIEDTAPDQEL